MKWADPNSRTAALCSIYGLVILACCSAAAQDSLRSLTIAPGVEHLHFTQSGPYEIHVLKVDLREKSIFLETYRPDSLTPASVQVQQNTRPGNRVLAAINADFFSFQTHWPLGNQIRHGRFVAGATSRRSHFGMDQTKKPLIERFSFRGSVMFANGSRADIHAINHILGSDSIVLYNAYWKVRRVASAWQKTMFLKSSHLNVTSGDTVAMVVDEMDTVLSEITDDAAAIGLTKYTDREVKARLHDTLKLFLDIAQKGFLLTEVVGGGGRILVNGRKSFLAKEDLEGIGQAFFSARHPRTFVGFDKDSTHVFLCTVDGRQQKSVGMNFEEMSDFLLSLGVWNAVNLDGGGSTTMVIGGKVVNSPSDKTGERPVANTIQVIQIE